MLFPLIRLGLISEYMNIAGDVANNVLRVVAQILQTLKMKKIQGVLMTIPRITIVCCISAAGEKLPIQVIGTAERPYCFYDKGRKKNILLLQ